MFLICHIISASKTFWFLKAFIIQLQRILLLLGIHTTNIVENISSSAKKAGFLIMIKTMYISITSWLKSSWIFSKANKPKNFLTYICTACFLTWERIDKALLLVILA